MKLDVHCRLAYHFTEPTEAVAIIQAAQSSDQRILSETLTLSPPATLAESCDQTTGARLLRGTLAGHVILDYRATVDNGVRQQMPADAVEHAWADLPVGALPHLLPSRYCPADRFQGFVDREFGDLSGGAKVLAILDWIHTHIDYVPGTSTSATTATDTFIDRAGVCRDFTHLGITLCRATNIPARAVAVYALELDPADFHAVFEVFLGGRWWFVDATRLAPIEGFVRIAVGRDAADIAFLTTRGGCEQTWMEVAVALAA